MSPGTYDAGGTEHDHSLALVSVPAPVPGRLRNLFLFRPPAAEQPPARVIGDAETWATWGAARDGARITLTRAQRYGLLIALGLLLVLLWVDLRAVLIASIALVTVIYFLTGGYKIWLLVRGERARTASMTGGKATATATPQALDERATLEGAEDEVPMYTILVPLHREGKILPTLIKRLKSLDYPKDRLEIFFLAEMMDIETQTALRACRLPAHMHQLIMPPGQPQTKPRALNVGLSQAHGDYIVIYDAEDRPEPDQLRKVLAAFRQMPDTVVCLQARLNFYNRHQTLLSRLFAVDYAVWYDQLLPGLAHLGHTRSGAFVPLGGTSNHFRVGLLRQLGGWDPFNVTEDCDLGARIGRAGFQVGMLDSTTWEEAVIAVRPWIRQRSRWVKGYMQTYLVHMRHPLRLWRQIGTRGFIDFQMLVGGSSLVLLLNPLMWALMAAYIAGAGTSVDAFIESLFPAPLYYMALMSLTAGNFLFFYVNAYVCVRHDYIDLTRYALLTPVYWLFLSTGAWAGLVSLVRHPHYWAKTEHGVSLRQHDRVQFPAGRQPYAHT